MNALPDAVTHRRPSSTPPTLALGVYARERLRGLGAAGWAGALACLLAVVLFLFSYLPGQAALGDLEGRLAAETAQPSRIATPVSGKGDITQWPQRGELPAIVGLIVKQAESAGVVLERGTYSYAPLRAGRATRYQLQFPIKAPYPQVRKFLDLTLDALPMAGIDTLSIERKAIGEPLVDANIGFVVVARSAP